MRIELTTARLRIGCSTPELLWQVLRNGPSTAAWRCESSEPSNTLQSKALASSTHAQCLSCPGADSNRYAFRHHPLKMACLPISPPGQNQRARAANSIRTLRTYPRSQNKTGPTGLEPATSRVTVECSNQTELRPQLLESGSATPSSLRTFLYLEPGVSQLAE